MVRVEGFEPPTAWFVARNSIQLSYTRVKSLIDQRTLLHKEKSGARGRIRTSDRLVRSQELYPAELHAHITFTFNYFVLPFDFFFQSTSVDLPLLQKNGGEGGIRTLDRAINSILP
jgi:hypothetical protein